MMIKYISYIWKHIGCGYNQISIEIISLEE